MAHKSYNQKDRLLELFKEYKHYTKPSRKENAQLVTKISDEITTLIQDLDLQ